MKQEIASRIGRLQSELEKTHLDGALVVQKMDVYYFSGTDQDAHLWIPCWGEPLLMVRRDLGRAKRDSFLSKVIPLSGLSSLPELISTHGGTLPGRVGLELDVLPARNYLAYQKLFPAAEMIDVSTVIREIRMVKSPLEIGWITEAAHIADQMFEKVPELLEEAKTELDLALRIEAFYRSRGHQGLLRLRNFNSECFYGHIMAGKNAAVSSNSAGPTGGQGLGPYYSQGPASTRIPRYAPILVDYTSIVQGYISDQTRIFSLGRVSERLMKSHDVMCRVQEFVLKEGRPGVEAGSLYEGVIDIARKAGLLKNFMGTPDPVPFVGHGLGLELDEWPVIGRNNHTVLQEGMVIALEPKCIFPGQGTVGVENTLVVTKTGMERLNRFPDAIAVC